MSDSDRKRPAHIELLAVAWNFGWPVVAGVIAGYWIDQKLGSSPLATLAVGLGAMAASMRRLILLSRQEEAERRDEESREDRTT